MSKIKINLGRGGGVVRPNLVNIQKKNCFYLRIVSLNSCQKDLSTSNTSQVGDLIQNRNLGSGALSLSQCKSAPRARWPGRRLTIHAHALYDAPIVPPHEDGDDYHHDDFEDIHYDDDQGAKA